jgi:GNAT superfamily N-acetyltransferase
VRPGLQRHGAGSALLAQLRGEVDGPLLVGTWRAAWWAVRFYEKHGFSLASPEEKDALLQAYWTVPARQRAESVVLRSER